MTTNSLAFRLFATAAAWTLMVLPIAGAIIYSLYKQEVETSFDRRMRALLTVILSDAIEHVDCAFRSRARFAKTSTRSSAP
jgi:hypothetical protein